VVAVLAFIAVGARAATWQLEYGTVNPIVIRDYRAYESQTLRVMNAQTQPNGDPGQVDDGPSGVGDVHAQAVQARDRKVDVMAWNVAMFERSLQAWRQEPSPPDRFAAHWRAFGDEYRLAVAYFEALRDGYRNADSYVTISSIPSVTILIPSICMRAADVAEVERTRRA
jgi:hypothetical protein